MFGGDKSYDYHRCTVCGLLYQYPTPSSEEIENFYPASYIVYRQPTRIEFTRKELWTLKNKLGYHHLTIPGGEYSHDSLLPSAAINDVIPYIENGSVLDIGCGNGEYLLRLKSIGWRCKGVEFNDTAVSICRSHALDVFQGELHAAGFESESFDFVTAHHLIEHVPNPSELMREIARITKTGGSVLIRTPNSESLGRSWFGTNWYANDVPRHLFLFSAKNLELLAAHHGLQLRKLFKPVKPKLVLKSLDYKLNNRGTPSKKRKILKWLSRLYIPAAQLSGRGDELFAIFTKRAV